MSDLLFNFFFWYKHYVWFCLYFYITLDDPSKVKEEIKIEIKEEPVQELHKPMQNCYREDNSTDDDDEERLVIKDEPNSQDEAEEPNNSAASSCDYNLSHFKKDESQFDVSEEEMDQDNSQQDDCKVEPKDEEESDEDVPLVSMFNSF